MATGFAVVLLLSGAVASAQGQTDKLKSTTPEERAAVQTLTMKQKLGLSAEQVPAVKQINLETATEMQPILESDERPMLKMRKVKSIEAQRDESLQKVLTPPQYQQWLAEKEAMREKVEQKLMEKRSGGAQ